MVDDDRRGDGPMHTHLGGAWPNPALSLPHTTLLRRKGEPRMKIGVSVLMTTSGVLTGLLVITGELVFVTTVLPQAIGADTPISGVTVGAIMLGLIAASAAAMKAVTYGGRQLFAWGRLYEQWRDGIEAAAELGPVVESATAHLVELDRRVGAVEKAVEDMGPISAVTEALAKRVGPLRDRA